MAELKIEAKTEKGKGPGATVTIDFPATTKDLVTKWGEEAVYSRARSAFVIDMQALLRGAVAGGKKPTEIQTLANNWVPGVRAKGKSAAEKASDLLSKLSDEEKAELFKKFAGGGKGGKR